MSEKRERELELKERGKSIKNAAKVSGTLPLEVDLVSFR